MQSFVHDLRVPLARRFRLASAAALVLACSHGVQAQSPVRLARDVPPVPVYATEWTPVGQPAMTTYSPPVVTSYAPGMAPMPMAGVPAPHVVGYPVVESAPVTTYLPASPAAAPPAYFAAPSANSLYAPSATYAPMIAPSITAPAPVVGYAPPTYYVPAPPPSNRARRRMWRQAGW